MLRRTPKPGDGAALLLIVGDHFMLVEELPKPVPRAGSSPCAPGEPLCVAACALYGRVSDKWEVKVASLPWLEGARLFGGEDGLRRVTSVTSETVGILEAGDFSLSVFFDLSSRVVTIWFHLVPPIPVPSSLVSNPPTHTTQPQRQ